ncbi:DUF4160 domain-containing protein [Crocosphaera sp. XPORK-15E]|uniref:DUF4160 domain-containing protein n=1 Tax=Crocosphaera sp. XPORK-15E TaxID=3110247 RepID=UPI002B1F1896|nr:DUF4160 domain-containing protein [Crocosphaera sp. XPORK-15E]MEA5534697.1 DUF4160 domain-containing protein [Crocosphaera sp. XPORK-15E]
MPTVLRKDGFCVRIYPNDHLPSHVHVFKADGEAKINLGNETQRPTFVTISAQMSNQNAAKALKLVIEKQKFLLQKWREIHEQS